MTCVVFTTPGLMDIRSVTVMGLSAKPNSKNPIGYFGTGLKYSIGCLIRLGCKPVIWIGEDRYEFSKKEGEFRGATYEGLNMNARRKLFQRSKNHDLPFTTQYGRNWVPWQVVRELESNTRDEGGRSVLYENASVADFAGHPASTLILVDLPEFIEAYRELDKIFLPGGLREGPNIQVLPDESDFLYWRGLKVYELNKPSLFTYNFTSCLELTEDRTLKYEFMAKAAFARFVQTHDDEEFIEKVLTCDDEFWESGLEFEKHLAPSAAFHNVMQRHPKGMNASAVGYYVSHDTRISVQTFDLFEAHPRPWKIEGNEVQDAKGVTIFDAPYGYKGKWPVVAEAILKHISIIELRQEEPDVADQDQ